MSERRTDFLRCESSTLSTLSMTTVFRFTALFVMATVALAFNTTGFDFYLHAHATMSWERMAEINNNWLLPMGVEFPRYLLGLHILYILTLGVIPVGWVVVTIQAVVALLNIQRLEKKAWYLAPLLGLYIAYNMVFMSMNGLAYSFLILAGLSYWTGRVWLPWFALGSAFHPVGFVLAVIMAIVLLPKVRAFAALALVLCLSILLAATFEDVRGVRSLFFGTDYLEYEVSRTISRIIRLAELAVVAAVALISIRLIRRYFHLPRIPLPGALLTAMLLIGFAAYQGHSAQMTRGGLYNYLVEKNYYGRTQTDKNALICAAWVSRRCYDDIELSTRLSFRQDVLK